VNLILVLWQLSWLLCLSVGLPEILNFNFFRVLRGIPRTEKILPTCDYFWGENKWFYLIRSFSVEKLTVLVVSGQCHFDFSLKPALLQGQYRQLHLPKIIPILFFFYFFCCTVHIGTIESFIYPTDAQLDCSKNVKIYIKIYMRGAATCFGFSQSPSDSYCFVLC
jgi:hypothetical protein